MAMIETWVNQDLTAPVQVVYLPGNVFSQDNNGNRIGVNVFQGGEPATLSGSVSASVIRADGATVAVTGTLSGNQCSVVLPQACYAVPGVLSIVIKLTDSANVTTLAAVVANVYRSSTDTAVDPGQIIPDISALIEAINEAVASIPPDYSALVTATTVVDGETISNAVPWMFGGIANGVDTDYVNRIKSDYIPISEYDRITFTVDSGYMQAYVLYDATRTYITGLDFTTSEQTLSVPESGAAYIRLCMRNSGNTTMELSDLRRMKAVAYRLNAEEISNTTQDVRNVRNVSDDITVGSWKIGYVYADGGIDISAQPNYVCTMCLQKFPIDVYLTPDAGYQVMVRVFDATGTNVVYSSSWMTETFFIPENTYFIINMSKATPVAVGDNLQSYIDALHFRSRAVFILDPPAANKKTKLAVLGDSISTYSGWIETGYNSAYYPTGDVTNVDLMWWKIVADELGITDIVVSAISQSAYYDYGETMYPPIYDAGRIARIGTDGAPDVVFINAGTNDGFVNQSESIVYSEDISTLEALPNSTVKGIALTIRRIQAAYPAAKIVLMIPKQVKLSSMQTGYDLQRVTKIADELVAYAEMFGVWKVIDLRKCGINQSNVASFCGDGVIHPNAKGMREMARYIIDELR